MTTTPSVVERSSTTGLAVLLLVLVCLVILVMM